MIEALVYQYIFCSVLKYNLCCAFYSKSDIASLSYEEGKEEKLLAEKKQLMKVTQNLQEKLEKLESKLVSVLFTNRF